MADQLSEIRILSVEDDEFITLFLTDVMWIFGAADHIKFLSASDTEKAMEIVRNPETRPQLILLDLALPDKPGATSDPEHGFRFLELVKTDPALMDIKILVFSGSKDAGFLERATRLGAEKFLVKGDYLPRELIEVVRTALNLPVVNPPTA